MKKIGVFAAIALGLMWVHAFSFAEPAAEQRILVKSGIEKLLASVDTYSASEKPRLGKTEDGSLCFFGAPPNGRARLGAALENDKPENKALGFLRQHAAAFGIYGIHVDFNIEKTTTEKDRTFVRMGQTYGGLPVCAAEVVVQLDGVGGVTAVLSDIMRNIGSLETQRVSLNPSLSVEQAETIALNHKSVSYQGMDEAPRGTSGLTQEDVPPFTGDLTVEPTSTLMVYDPSVVGSKGEVCVVWKVVVAGTTDPFVKETVLVNANSGEVALSYPLVYSAMRRRVSDQENDVSKDEQWHLYARYEGDPAYAVPEVNTAYDNLGFTYAYYAGEHGRDGIDDSGGVLYAMVRWCPSPLSNLYGWCFGQCPCPNAVFASGKMYFGEGRVCDDIVAHEYTHGVTDATSQLLYFNQSGAISESFSDIWGEFVDLTPGGGNDSPEVRWFIGEDLPGGKIRDMKNPPSLGHPDSMWSDNYLPDSDNPSFFNDYGGVHTNCGVNNKLAFLLTDGGTFNDRTITAMGISSVGSLYYECQTHLLTSASDYSALYYALTQAAVNLGFTQAERNNIEQACRAVEIRLPVCLALKTANEPSFIQFRPDGDIYMMGGNIVQQQSTITPNASIPEWIVKDAQGVVLAMADSASSNLLLRGKLYEGVSAVWNIPDGSLIIRNSGGPVAFLTSVPMVAALLEPRFPFIVPAGSLIIKGNEIASGY